MMYAGAFEINGWMGRMVYIFKGESADEIMERFERLQDFDCLIRMGRMQEGPCGQKALDVLETVVEKYRSGVLEIEDLKSLQSKLSIGGIRCLAVAEGKTEIEKLIAEYPTASVFEAQK